MGHLMAMCHRGDSTTTVQDTLISDVWLRACVGHLRVGCDVIQRPHLRTLH